MRKRHRGRGTDWLRCDGNLPADSEMTDTTEDDDKDAKGLDYKSRCIVIRRESCF